ncbi:hypothetical protein HPB48_005838 [Haemaphysalis longicornis]|uniref:Uncharacterized protein n=1 Tax=Haemaphysalis longicornis TaxID=44386 RepID=A0A9J6GML0_HAELO|nr:hypothetical protein HPB48_005838 [Haemaphysalis longicornis]
MQRRLPSFLAPSPILLFPPRNRLNCRSRRAGINPSNTCFLRDPSTAAANRKKAPSGIGERQGRSRREDAAKHLAGPDSRAPVAATILTHVVFNKVTSLIVICLGEVRLQVHFDKLLENKPPDRGPPDKKPREFKLQLSRKARALFKRLSVHVCNASVMQLGAPSQDCLLHATLQEIAFHVLARDAEFYVSLNVFSAAVKIFKHPQDTSHNDSCLADFCVTVQGSAVVSAKDISVAHNITLNIAQPEIVLYEDRLIEALSSSEPTVNRAVPSTPEEEEPSKDESESAALDDMDSERAELKALVAKMPEAVYVKMESASVKVLRDNWNKGLFLEVHSFTAELLQDSSQSCFATCLLALSNLALTSDQFQLAALAKAEATGKLHHEQVDVNVKLAALRTAYSEDELRHWAQLLPASPRPPVERKRASKTLTQRLSSLKMLVRASAELEDVSVSVITADYPASHFKELANGSNFLLCAQTRHTSSDLRVQCMLGSVHSEVNPRVSGLVAHWSSKVAAKAALRRPEQKPALMHAQQVL